MYKYVYAAGSGDQFFIHRTEIFDFVVRWDKKVYRRQEGKYIEKIMKIHNDGWIWNVIKGLGSIFYKRTVVGDNIFSTTTKMGARIHRTVALRMRIMTYTIV